MKSTNVKWERLTDLLSQAKDEIEIGEGMTSLDQVCFAIESYFADKANANLEEMRFCFDCLQEIMILIKQKQGLISQDINNAVDKVKKHQLYLNAMSLITKEDK